MTQAEAKRQTRRKLFLLGGFMLIVFVIATTKFLDHIQEQRLHDKKIAEKTATPAPKPSPTIDYENPPLRHPQ